MASALFSRRRLAGPGGVPEDAPVEAVWPAAKAANKNKTNTICLILGRFRPASGRFFRLGLIFSAATRFFRPFK